MGGLYGRKGNRAKNKKTHRELKTKGYKKAIDQVYEDMKPENYQQLKQQKVDETLPGLGQFYCVPCCRYFVNQESIVNHELSKLHKRAYKRTLEVPYSHKEAEQLGK